MKIWTVTTDDNCGHQCDVYATESEADAAAWVWIKDKWGSEDGPIPENIEDALDQIGQHEDFIFYEEHEIPDVEMIRSAKAQMSDLIDQIEQMKGMFSDDDSQIKQSTTRFWPTYWR